MHLSEHSSLEQTQLVEVFQIAEVAAGTSVEYLPFIKKRQIRPLKSARAFDRIVATRISGDSLIGDNIRDGDYAICKLNFEPYELTNGRIVIAKTPLGTFIKHFYVNTDGTIRLASANPDYPDLVFDLDDVEVQALVMRTERDWD